MGINYANKMMAALIAHIKYLKASGSYKTVITNGQLTGQMAGRYVYRFDSEFASNLDREGDIDLEINDSRIAAQIVSLKDKSVELSLATDCGQRIDRAAVVSNNYLLQEKLKERIDTHRKKAGVRLGDQLLEPHKGDPRDTSGKSLIKSNWDQSLNKQQHTALESALKNKITYIWGPPGTGKTKVIASIIDSYNQNGLSVLLLSNTNIATDEALYKTAAHFEQTDNSILRDGKVIRIGTIHHKQLEEEYSQYITKDSIIARKTAGIQEKIDEYEKQLSEQRQNKQEAKQRLAGVRVYARLISLVGIQRQEVANADFQIQELAEEPARNKMLIEENEQRWLEYKSRSRLKQILSLDSEGGFQGTEAELLSRQVLIPKEQEAWVIESEERRRELQKVEEQVENAKSALGGLNKRQLTKQLNDAIKTIGQLTKLLDNLQAQIKRLEGKIIKEAKLVAATLANSYLHSGVLEREYDCVIIDEISMSSPPAVWHAANMAKSRVVVVGDFMQLPPIAQYRADKDDQSSDEGRIRKALINKWLKQDIFQLSGLQEAIKDSQQKLPSNLVALQRQYRMQKPIADLVNHLVYGRYRGGLFALETGLAGTNDKDKLLSGAHLAVCDTGEQKPYVSYTANRSQYCILQAVLTTILAQKAIQKGYSKIGITSAYRAQANLIQMILKDKGLEQQVEANTIHSFQGGEKSLMILDITTPEGSSMYDNDYQREETEKLLNVALSRAQEECIIVGNVKAIRANHSKVSPVRSILDYLEKNDFPFRAAEYFSDASVQATEINHTLEQITPMFNPDGFYIFTEENFYNYFKYDLKKAQKEIIIVSPYMTVHRINDLMGMLDGARRKGINVFVLTRSLGEQDEIMAKQAQEAMEKLAAQRIIVLPLNENLHQKLAFLDRRVFWSGSLNILSWRNTRESMLRQDPSEHAIAELLANLNLDKNIGEIGENNFRKCENCNGIGAYYWHKGRQIYCLSCKRDPQGSSAGPKLFNRFSGRSSMNRQGSDSQTAKPPSCPKHKLLMRKRKNSKDGSFFWGCPKYSDDKCRETRPMDGKGGVSDE